ncbi:hypothetical protein M378DRAFT_10735 [Amanita muscaria Koide BX008]|uniref:Pescadillo homolog n=1 Tax=Amanita muscaria (strain Koide BX008) TaxID=946122 RepID=A0A0C2WV49_AMAMK|nr:hypothetical protein M378DRAFT_10735 [Amanita muscaria Koide BX008]
MGRLKQKGKAGAVKAYITRTSAIRKLQCSLADFRRLCILKGIFPREPRNKKRANKGSSAPASFYYTKDIAYLAHEPVLKKLREHKAFAKKLSRALGRREWSTAKSLEENKPVYRLDHIIKERYPAFIDAVRDIDDALCMIFLFASLPAGDRLSTELVESCSRLASEWQLYVLQTRSLRKVFLSIKGIYYQAEIMDQLVTWLVPYQFTQQIPSDVDVRVMLTFLELYQTVLGFVFFKLYTDVGLVYPPPLDAAKDEGAAGIGAFTLREVTHVSETSNSQPNHKTVEVDGRKVSGKDVRQAIKSIAASSEQDIADSVMSVPEPPAATAEVDEEFVPQPSKSDSVDTSLRTLKSLSSLPQTTQLSLFVPYTFFLSREISRPIFEFLIRSSGGRVGWPASSGSGSPLNENDESITHVIIDRPVIQKTGETSEERERRLRRKYVQPQWVADCINAGKILLEGLYAQGQTLPPHLSPFEEYSFAPSSEDKPDEDMNAVETEEEEEEEAEEEEKEVEQSDSTVEMGDEKGESEDPEKKASKAIAKVTISEDPAALRAAELAAEAAGMDYATFAKEVKKLKKRSHVPSEKDDREEDMNKMMMSNRQRKLYEKMKYSQRKKEAEQAKLAGRRDKLMKERRREAKKTA